jgi:hypothetical protein
MRFGSTKDMEGQIRRVCRVVQVWKARSTKVKPKIEDEKKGIPTLMQAEQIRQIQVAQQRLDVRVE